MLFRKFTFMTCLALALVVSPPVQAKKNQPALIEWGERITLTPPQGGLGRYPRLTKITRGVRAGDLLICYQSGLKGGDFWLYRSSDLGRSWDNARKVNSATRQWNFASCNIIQLNDGRLMMSMLRRARGSNLSRDYYMDDFV